MRPNFAKVEQAKRQQVILAPETDLLSSSFQNVQCEPELHGRILRDLQRLRGRVYVRDGAIRREDLTLDGRHESPVDESCWHLVTLERGSVVACARIHVHSVTARFEHLGVSRASIAKCPTWGRRLKTAVDMELRRARAMGCHFVELGGWALDETVRHTMEAFRIALGAFAWSSLTGGAIGLTTATFRNHSADILQKLGGCPIRDSEVELPRYFDPQYDCEMQILSFETGGYAPRFHSSVTQLTRELATASLICATPAVFRTFFPTYSVSRAHASAA